MKACKIPVQKRMCKSCPFSNSEEALTEVLSVVTHSAMTEATRICHSTGRTGFKGNTGKAEKICRGARDLQLKLFRALGFIEAATDEAWDKKCKELRLKSVRRNA